MKRHKKAGCYTGLFDFDYFMSTIYGYRVRAAAVAKSATIATASTTAATAAAPAAAPRPAHGCALR